MQGARGQCSNRRRVSNKRRVSIKHRGFEVRVLINAGGVYFTVSPYAWPCHQRLPAFPILPADRHEQGQVWISPIELKALHILIMRQSCRPVKSHVLSMRLTHLRSISYSHAHGWNLMHSQAPQWCFFQYSFCDFSLLPHLKFYFFCRWR